MDTVGRTILTYETAGGEKPADEFIKKQQPPRKNLDLGLLRMKESTTI